jgi:hypothetical protein
MHALGANTTLGEEVTDETRLVKVWVEISDEDEVVSGESLWANPVGPERYEIRNVPFRAYDLHFNDVVHARAEAPDQKPRVLKVVSRSGHKTLRVIFSEATSEPEQVELLDQLRDLGATYERANTRLVAIDVEPAGDYQAVCDKLWAWEQAGKLDYETGVRSE